MRRVMPGLDLVVPAQGPASWMVRYQPRGLAPNGKRWAPRTVKIGSTASHSLPEAMDETVRLKARVLAGEDPAEDRRAAAQRRRERARAAQARLSCREALTAYGALLAVRRLSTRHARDEVGHAYRALASVGMVDAPPALVTTAMVEAAMARCPAGSQRARFAALHRFLVWALRNEGAGAVSPTLLLSRHERPKPVAPRERVLSAAEVAAIWHAAASHPVTVTGDVVQFLISVPARENEVGQMRWHDVDMAARVWEMPTSKNGAPHRFPLNAHALAILQRRRWAAGGTPPSEQPVFPAPKSNGKKPYVSWNGAKLWLDRQSGVVGWVIHDFRRSFATLMAEAGFDDGVLDLSLNHRASGSRNKVTRTYNLSLRWLERVRLMHAWSTFLDTAIGGPRNPDQTADILELPGIANAAGVSPMPPKTQTLQGSAGEADDNSAGSAAPALSEVIVRAIEGETPADAGRDMLRRLVRIEAAVAGETPAPAEEKVEKNPGGGRPLDIYIGALVDFMAGNVAGFADAVAETLPKIARPADRRAVEQFLLVFAEVFEIRLIERIRERNRQHFVYERPRLPKDWEHTLADAMRRWNKKEPPGE